MRYAPVSCAGPDMKRLYAIFAATAFSFFAWAQYNAYGLFDKVAEQEVSKAGSRNIFHK
ncbi:hypothetical protein FACS1894158_00520 [Betaproteobacteria bacterium]|nr:hypothetical protein FACS1894158_00520 [Betaproteobacteria bacterium]